MGYPAYFVEYGEIFGNSTSCALAVRSSAGLAINGFTVPLIDTGPFALSFAATSTGAETVECVPNAPIVPVIATRFAVKFGLMKLSV